MLEDEDYIIDSWQEGYRAGNVSDCLDDIYYKYSKKIRKVLDKLPAYILNYVVTVADIDLSIMPQPTKAKEAFMASLKEVFMEFHEDFIKTHEDCNKRLTKKCIFKGYIERERGHYSHRERYWYIGEDYRGIYKRLKAREAMKAKMLETSNMP